MLKPIDNSISIESIKILEKKGGVKDFSDTHGRKLNAAVIVVSDTRKKEQDTSGKTIINTLKNTALT